jgi:hypothetical protein
MNVLRTSKMLDERDKYEIRIPKFETNSNDRNSNDQNVYNLFRASDLEFRILKTDPYTLNPEHYIFDSVALMLLPQPAVSFLLFNLCFQIAWDNHLSIFGKLLCPERRFGRHLFWML